jgi:hypothetical protein
MNSVSKTLTLEDLTNYRTEHGEDYVLSLIRQGYKLESQPLAQPVQYAQMTQSTQTLDTSGSTDIALAIGVLIIGAVLYFKWWLPTRYGLESAAARKAGVNYSAVGLTGTSKGY